MSPFDDDDLSEAYAALAEEAEVPAENRRELLKRLIPSVGLGLIALLIVGVIGTLALNARNQAAVVQTAGQEPKDPAPVTTAQPQADQSPPASSPSDATNGLPTRTTANPDLRDQGAHSDHTEDDLRDLALRYATTWANQGGGLDPMVRAQQLAIMRGGDPNQAPVEKEITGMQVVLDAHIANVKVRNTDRLVTVSLLLAGAQAPNWAALQLVVSPTHPSGWVVTGNPVWVAYTPPSPSTQPPAPQPVWQDLQSHPDAGLVQSFFMSFAKEAQITDPQLVATPINGLNGSLNFDRIEGIAQSAHPNQLLVRVRWVNSTGLAMSQVYMVNRNTNGRIDSIEVGAIE